MHWTRKAILITFVLCLVSRAGVLLAQDGNQNCTDFRGSRCCRTSVNSGLSQTAGIAISGEEIPSEELEAITGKGLGDKDRLHLPAKIILGDEIDVDHRSGVAFYNQGLSALNVQRNSLVIGTK